MGVNSVSSRGQLTQTSLVQILIQGPACPGAKDPAL